MDEAQFRTKLAQEGYEAGEVTDLAPGMTKDTHVHDFSAMILVLDGEITVMTEDGDTTCGAGETFSLAAGIPHSERVGADGVRFLAGRK